MKHKIVNGIERTPNETILLKDENDNS